MRDIIYIEWFDPTSQDEWTAIEEVIDECPHSIVSAGFLLKETDDAIVISLSIDVTAANTCMYMLIPKALISRRLLLKKGDQCEAV